MTPPIISVQRQRVLCQKGTGHNKRPLEYSILRPTALPFLKWAGGKQWLARVAHLVFPTFSGCYYEPFLGGASIFFALAPHRAVLSDKNDELITTYRVVAKNVEGLISELGRYPYNKEFYAAIRSRQPRLHHKIAARFIYLNKTAWNGLYRVNQKGKFNVPFGSYENVTICPADRLREASKALSGASIRCSDFAAVTRNAKEGDLVYFDPPYTTKHNNNGFLKYNATLFSWRDQLRLARAASRLADRGVHVVVSNADHGPLLELYKGFHCCGVQRNSLIGGAVSSRGRIGEVLLTSFPLRGLSSEVI